MVTQQEFSLPLLQKTRSPVNPLYSAILMTYPPRAYLLASFSVFQLEFFEEVFSIKFLNSFLVSPS
jgi:hypothetical protein